MYDVIEDSAEMRVCQEKASHKTTLYDELRLSSQETSQVDPCNHITLCLVSALSRGAGESAQAHGELVALAR